MRKETLGRSTTLCLGPCRRISRGWGVLEALVVHDGDGELRALRGAKSHRRRWMMKAEEGKRPRPPLELFLKLLKESRHRCPLSPPPNSALWAVSRARDKRTRSSLGALHGPLLSHWAPQQWPQRADQMGDKGNLRLIILCCRCAIPRVKRVPRCFGPTGS